MAVTESFSVRTFDDPLSLVVTGEIDLATADELRLAMDDVIARRGDVPVVLDLAGVTFIDSTGLSVLAQAAASGDEIVLRDPPKVVRSILALTGLGESFSIEGDGL
jgi:anti-sigma B factor antagonist